jgi:hypothetical protein
MPAVFDISTRSEHPLEELALTVDKRDHYGGNTEYLGGQAAEGVETFRFGRVEKARPLESREPARAG